ncbi:MAG: ABC transporter ATP-binding protein [Ectothiorhodospiraceae bacterium AqS1]|nr:ABC transporter ATP-binding protein [Ectothiorhodospiraceae bacterium AqS1]
MAEIALEGIRHSYSDSPLTEADYALKGVDGQWADGGAYALLGPSGCGKSTLLNIVSGLLRPSEGRIRFDGKDVTALDPVDRHVAQVFQFPVIYDTMTVYENLAFPLRNRGMKAPEVDARVREIASMLDLDDMLMRRAVGLTADGKQKISLGRGLVRSDVNVIMFDEPLTVIDPHLKWMLRSKLKEVHRRFGATMIYVTHDQIEALTFADKVMVMTEGEVVQIGTPVELFERPQHTFVGYFIGSPGMNVMPCSLSRGDAIFDGEVIAITEKPASSATPGSLELGVRPEFVTFAEDGLSVEIVRVDDIGRHKIVDLKRGRHRIKMLAGEDDPIPGQNPRIRFDPDHTRIYADGRLLGG